jgi:hypothetical protein
MLKRRSINMYVEKTITITQEEYDMLLDSQAKLSALECAGVDNWEGYNEAMKIYREGLGEE